MINEQTVLEFLTLQVYQTETRENFKLVEMNGNIFESTDPLAQITSVALELTASVVKQYIDQLASKYPEFLRKKVSGKSFAKILIHTN